LFFYAEDHVMNARGERKGITA